MYKECEFGDHGPIKTWCHHEHYNRGDGPRAFRNEFCGECPLFQLRTSEKPQKSKPNRLDCIHLGDVAGDVMCKTCSGRKVVSHSHNCGLGGECVVKMRHWEWAKEFDVENGIRVKRKCCETCSERKQPELNEQE